MDTASCVNVLATITASVNVLTIVTTSCDNVLAMVTVCVNVLWLQLAV